MSVTSKALWFIESHPTEELSLETIASSVGVSRFHLSRAFSTTLECSVVAYVRARRLSEAAKLLAGGASDILDVALEAGYGSHEAFTRAFRQHFGLTPEQLRAHGTLDEINLQEAIRMEATTNITLAPPTVRKAEELLIFGVGQNYNCANKAGIPAQWARFEPHIEAIANRTKDVYYGAVCNMDPAGDFEYICGVPVSEFPLHPADFRRLHIPAQTYAVFEHRDHISSIGETMGAIWNHALPASGFKAKDAPLLERYDERFDGRTGLGGLEIWVPIED